MQAQQRRNGSSVRGLQAVVLRLADTETYTTSLIEASKDAAGRFVGAGCTTLLEEDRDCTETQDHLWLAGWRWLLNCDQKLSPDMPSR